MQPLTLKYRSQVRLSDVRGQHHVTNYLKAFVKNPYSRAFLLSGTAGIGKTMTAYALANELGIDTAQPELGGFYQLNSGETTAVRVREVLNACHLTPMWGSGWRLVCCNEVDTITPGADKVWLDGLESLPPRTIVVFTTNKPHNLEPRFRDRCICFEYENDITKLRQSAVALVRDLWRRETGREDAPSLKELGITYTKGLLSFRGLTTQLEARITVIR